MNERRFKVLAIMLVILGAVFLLSALKIGPQRGYGLCSVLGYTSLVISVVLCVAFYSKKYNMYDTYAYIPVFLVLSPILNIGHGNKCAVFFITLAEIVCIVAATCVVIRNEEKKLCKAICSKWKLSLTIIIFFIAMTKFAEDTFDRPKTIDMNMFLASSAIVCAFQFCIYLMDIKIEEWQDEGATSR